MSETRASGEIGPAVEEELERDYAAYRECFNRGRYYEAHDALEPLWLRVRGCEIANLLKGLIQLSGAFVHLQKDRLGPARALLGRARFHLEPFVKTHPLVDVPRILELIGQWEIRVGSAITGDQLLTMYAPPALPGSRVGTRCRAFPGIPP
jgi:hypothetical protein